MAHRVIWADAAIEDLEAAAEYIRRDSPTYATAFVSRVLDEGRSLSRFPLRGRMVPEFQDERIREVLVYSYRLIYVVEADSAKIVALIHGRRDLRRAWEEKDR